MTQALARCGVYGRPGPDEIDVLELADAYRRELCALHQERHEALIDLRNRLFPTLLPALFERERLWYEIAAIEREIKAYHSHVGDRNAVTVEQEQRLKAAREARKKAVARAKAELAPWSALLKEFRAVYKDAADWKNVKSLDKRIDALRAIQWPEHLRELAELWIDYDLQERELSRRYQDRGLHSAIRAEIVAASKPKIGKTGPGMRYQYGRRLDIKPWSKITLQFGDGGLSVADALAGNNRQFSLAPVYTNHKAKGDKTVYRVRQKIGVGDSVRWIEYTCKLHRELPPEAILKRWSLVVEGDKRYVVPIVDNIDISKPTGQGVLTYDLHWTVRKAGVEVASFFGTHVNERLVIPNWIVESRMAHKDTQQRCDLLANELLAQRGATPQPNCKQGVEALADWCDKHPSDYAAANQLDDMRHRLRVSLKESQRAIRCIEKIYETVARRVCQLHSQIVPDPIDLRQVKRYDTRDLLRVDVVPQRSREIMHALAPGKLKALLTRYGLEVVASGAVADNLPGSVRPDEETDLFTSYVNGLGRKTGTKSNQPNHRSQHTAESVVES